MVIMVQVKLLTVVPVAAALPPRVALPNQLGMVKLSWWITVIDVNTAKDITTLAVVAGCCMAGCYMTMVKSHMYSCTTIYGLEL
jgi:hypothetical protein